MADEEEIVINVEELNTDILVNIESDTDTIISVDDASIDCDVSVGQTIPVAGDSAYALAVKHGFVGTEEEWIASLKPDLSAYAKTTDVAADIAEVNTKITDTNSKVTKAQTDISAIETSVTNINTDISTIDASIVDTNSKVSAIDTKLATKQTTLIPGNHILIDSDATISVDANFDAESITYDNPTYPSVKAALDKLLYQNPTSSISGGGNYEVGQTITSVTLNWSYNKPMVSQSMNQGIGTLDPALRTLALTNKSITGNTTYTITGNDGMNSTSASTTIAFYYKRYWGVSANSSLDNAGILSLSSEFSSSRTQTRVFNCSGGKYFYFVIPTAYCAGISFKLNGLSYSDVVVSTVSLLNASGATVPCTIYRSGNLQTGSSINVEVD